jgi:hypothetical protein
VLTESDPSGWLAIRQVVAQANRSKAPKLPSRGKRIVSGRESRVGLLMTKASSGDEELDKWSRQFPRSRKGRHVENHTRDWVGRIT